MATDQSVRHEERHHWLMATNPPESPMPHKSGKSKQVKAGTGYKQAVVREQKKKGKGKEK